MSSSNCCFLTCIHISQEAGQVVWYSHLFQNFPQFIVIHTVKGFGIVNKAEIHVFLELSCIFHDPVDIGNLISCSSAFSKTSLNIRKFTVHILLKPGLENFEHYFTPWRRAWQPTPVFLPGESQGRGSLVGCHLWGQYASTQYASKFGKLSSGHRTGKGQFSFQSQRKAMPKSAQTTTQLHSSHTIVK